VLAAHLLENSARSTKQHIARRGFGETLEPADGLLHPSPGRTNRPDPVGFIIDTHRAVYDASRRAARCPPVIGI